MNEQWIAELLLILVSFTCMFCLGYCFKTRVGKNKKQPTIKKPYKGWKPIIEGSLKKDLDLYNSFSITANYPDGVCVTNETVTKTKYLLTIDLFHRRIFRLNLKKVSAKPQKSGS